MANSSTSTNTHTWQADKRTNTHWQHSTTYTGFHQPSLTTHAAGTNRHNISQSQQWGASRWGGVGGSASSAAELVEFPVILIDRGAGATRFRSLGPWFDGLDFGPGVGRPRQVRPLQGGRWLIACVSAVQQAQIGRVTSVGGVPVSCSYPPCPSMGWSAPSRSVRTQNRDSSQNLKHTKLHQCNDYPTGGVHRRSLCG